MLLAFAESSIQLVPDGTLLLHLVIIATMVALLNATLLKPINDILEKRERLTRGRLTEADQTLASVTKKVREYEQRLRDARAEGYALMEQEQAVIARERERKVSEVKSEITNRIGSEKEKLRIEAEQVKGSLKSRAREMAVQISERILRRPVSERDL
ncbi:MAG: ATP synthase F0 subunit B [Pyrinomonadaceae bacterium]